MATHDSNRRAFLKGLSALGIAQVLPACSSAPVAAKHFDAVLSHAPTPRPPMYGSLAAALNAAPATGEQPFRIFIPTGEWREHNAVSKPNIHLVGEGRQKTRLVFDDRANATRGEGVPASTLVIEAPDFRASHLTIANDFDYVANMPAEVDYDRTGASGAQARALHLTKQSDRAVFDDVALDGWQDTLFVDTGRSLFKNCGISGCVDFIYGAGIAVFERCEILTRTRPGKPFHGFIAAPSTDRRQRFGLIFLECRLLKDRDMAPHSVALGRPWRPGKTFADGRYGNPDAVPHAAFLRCWMDDHIVPEAWYPMHYYGKDGERRMLQPEEVRLFEFDSRGPGAGQASSRRRQLTAQEAREYQPMTIFAGWKHFS